MFVRFPSLLSLMQIKNYMQFQITWYSHLCFSILLSVHDVPLNAEDEAGAVLVLLDALLLVTDLSELVDDEGSDNLHDDFDDEEIAEIDEYVPEQRYSRIIVGEVISVLETDDPGILLEADAEGEHKAVVESVAVDLPAPVVEVEDRLEWC